jgi:transaldolase
LAQSVSRELQTTVENAEYKPSSPLVFSTANINSQLLGMDCHMWLFIAEFTEIEDYDDPYLRLYLDSADQAGWEKWAESGIIYGITTNPTILKRSNVPCTLPTMRQIARHAFELDFAELQLQAWGATMQEIYSCALDLTELDPRIVVKIPLSMEGLRAAKRLCNDDVAFTLTGVYSVHQVVTAMTAGASYIAPYLGRMNDAGKNGIEDIAKMQTIVDMMSTYDGECRLLVASLRSAEDIAALASEGCNVRRKHQWSIRLLSHASFVAD